MKKQIKSTLMASIIGANMLVAVGCQSTTDEVMLSNTGYTVPVEVGVGTVLEVNENNGILVVKTKIEGLSGNSNFDFKMFTQQFDDVANGVDLTNVKEVQIWTVNKDDIKAFSATISKENLQRIKDNEIYWNKVEQMKPILQNLYIRE